MIRMSAAIDMLMRLKCPKKQIAINNSTVRHCGQDMVAPAGAVVRCGFIGKLQGGRDEGEPTPAMIAVRPARVQREVSAERPPARGVSTGSSGLTNLGCLPASGVCLFFGDNHVKIFTAIMWATVAALGSIFPLAAAAAAEPGVLLAAGQGDKNVTHETAR